VPARFSPSAEHIPRKSRHSKSCRLQLHEEMAVLQTLDVLIGFTLVMLIMSMAVTMLTQFFGTWLFELKGKALREVIARLLAMLDRGLPPTEASEIANHILRDPLVAQPRLFSSSNSLATVVHREELVKLVLDFASNGDAERAAAAAQSGSADSRSDIEKLQDRLRQSLKNNGIDDPAGVLNGIRAAILELEKTRPELSTSMRAAAAVLNNAASDFLAKVNSWFDQSIDRASDIFTAQIRMVTFTVSLLVVLLFQLNSFQLINRLSVDKELRDRVVASAIERANPPAAAQSNTDKNKQEALPKKSIPQIIKDSGADQLDDLGLIAFPRSFDDWSNRWGEGYDQLMQLAGLILSALLLSLGAPFWYSMLANLVKLRSVIAGKDDAQRTERQTTQTVTAPSAR
jgi:hypothetical protein